MNSFTECLIFFFSSRRRHTRFSRDWSSDVCSSDLPVQMTQARQLAGQTARRLGFPPSVVDRVVLAASELGTNLMKYATDGQLVIVPSPGGLDVLAIDRGPGIERVQD